MGILIIGQAPPNVSQKIPYATTMLYSWLHDVGINETKALELFEFDAVYNKFPGYNKNGKGHAVPTFEQMEEYYPELKVKIDRNDKLWILGNCAMNYLKTKNLNKEVLFTMHPSMMNYNRYMKNKDVLLNQIKTFIYEKGNFI